MNINNDTNSDYYLLENMSSILRKVKSLPALLKKRKSSQKLEKLCDSIPLPFERPLSRPRNWLFLEHCQLLERLTGYFITLHDTDEEDEQRHDTDEESEQEQEEKICYWANDFDNNYPMTYRPDNNSSVSDSLLRGLRLDSSFTVPLTNDQQTTFTQYFRAHRPHRRL